MDKATEKTLHDAYFQTRSVEPERYNSMITLLQSFADQLSHHAESLAIIEEGSEPAAIAKARRYIHANLDDSLPLGTVAHEAGLERVALLPPVQGGHGLTLTDYVNRCRVEWAKKELLKPEKRVSEIAFEVGYQSLSQFNRSFARIVGSRRRPPGGGSGLRRRYKTRQGSGTGCAVPLGAGCMRWNGP
jgi:AraC-like DNA-binding protein